MTTIDAAEAEDVICENCGSTLEREDLYEHEGHYYCDTCHDDMFLPCIRCGSTYAREDLQLSFDDNWNKHTNRVVSGHQRLKILKELGHTELDVSVVDLPEDKEKALNLQMNNPAGEWDDAKLEMLIAELEAADIDMELTGWDEKEIKKMEINIDKEIQFENEINYDGEMVRIELYCNSDDIEKLKEKIDHIKKEIPNIIYIVKSKI